MHLNLSTQNLCVPTSTKLSIEFSLTSRSSLLSSPSPSPSSSSSSDSISTSTGSSSSQSSTTRLSLNGLATMDDLGILHAAADIQTERHIRPLTIAIEGSIGSGKSSLAQKLTQLLGGPSLCHFIDEPAIDSMNMTAGIPKIYYNDYRLRCFDLQDISFFNLFKNHIEARKLYQKNTNEFTINHTLSSSQQQPEQQERQEEDEDENMPSSSSAVKENLLPLKPYRILSRTTHGLINAFLPICQHKRYLDVRQMNRIHESYKRGLLHEKRPLDVDVIIYLRTAPQTCLQNMNQFSRVTNTQTDIGIDYLRELHYRYERWLNTMTRLKSIRKNFNCQRLIIIDNYADLDVIGNGGHEENSNIFTTDEIANHVYDILCNENFVQHRANDMNN